MISPVPPVEQDALAAVRAGAELRAARERLGLAVEDVAANLRIRASYLIALEQGNIAALPSGAYALAYVRTYARALGLDAEEMARRFKIEAGVSASRPKLDFPVPMPERGFPAGAVMLVALVLVIGAYTGWYRLSGEGRLPAETVSAIPQRLAPLAQQVVPPNTAAVTQPRPVRLASATALPAPQPPAQAAPPVMAISPTSAAAAQLTPQQESESLASNGIDPTENEPEGVPTTTATGVPLASVQVAAADQATTHDPGAPRTTPAGGTVGKPILAPPNMDPIAAPTPTASTGEHRVVIKATADSWLQVRDANGAILFSKILRAGDSWTVPQRPGLVLTTGNAGGTEIDVNGKPLPSLGANGVVRHNLPLDMTALENTVAAPSPPATTMQNGATQPAGAATHPAH